MVPYSRRWVPEWLSFSSPPVDGVGDPGGPLKATAASIGGNPDPDPAAEPAAAAAAKGASNTAAGAVPKVKKRLHLSLRK